MTSQAPRIAADVWAIAGITELQRRRLAQHGYRIVAAEAAALPAALAGLDGPTEKQINAWEAGYEFFSRSNPGISAFEFLRMRCAAYAEGTPRP